MQNPRSWTVSRFVSAIDSVTIISYKGLQDIFWRNVKLFGSRFKKTQEYSQV